MAEAVFSESLIEALLQDQLHRGGFRRLLWLTGSARWTQLLAEQLLDRITDCDDRLVISERGIADGSVSNRQSSRYLGQERGALVYDAFSGFNPNSFGQLAGIVRRGGWLVLLSPEVDCWPQFADPEHQSLTVEPLSANKVTGRFLSLLTTTLNVDPQLIHLSQQTGRRWPETVIEGPVQHAGYGIYYTAEQQYVVEQAIDMLAEQSPRPIVLTADRGRGKSAALGIIARQLCEQNSSAEVLVTAPQRASVNTLFELVGEHQARVGFQLPDQLVGERPVADLLLVDEAAAIPAPVLSQMLMHYPRIVFASTIHGYEGTGQGFAIRFRQQLDKCKPGWLPLTMKTPVRWPEGDPLETLTNRMLLLDTDPRPPTELLVEPERCRVEWIDRDQLCQRPDQLADIFGLLVSAHYRTTPGDLRILLDSPNVSVLCLKQDGQLLATMLVAREGGLDDELSEAIAQGTRRPRGHLLPQQMIAQLGLPAAGLSCFRIMRIATHPQLWRNGCASILLQALESYGRKNGIDYLGTSFALSADLLPFWQRADYQTVRLGSQRDPVSGAHAALMCLPLSSAAETMIDSAKQRFLRQFTHLLATDFVDLEWQLVQSLLPVTATETCREFSEDLRLFAFHHRPFEGLEWVLAQFVMVALPNSAELLTVQEREIVIRKLLQQQSWQTLAEVCPGQGRKGVISLLRSVIGKLLKADSLLISQPDEPC